MTARREYPEAPVPGVGAIVLRGDGDAVEVLLVRRAREPLAGSWSLPGGAIELGETASAACMREVAEETGLLVDVLETVEAVDIILHDDAGRVRFHYVIVDLLCRATGGRLLASSDAAEACWAPVRAVLDDAAFSLTATACTVIGKALHRYKELA